MKLFSYIDPGTGSLFVQGLIGSILALSLAFRRVIRKGMSKLKPTSSRQKTLDEKV